MHTFHYAFGQKRLANQPVDITNKWSRKAWNFECNVTSYELFGEHVYWESFMYLVFTYLI